MTLCPISMFSMIFATLSPMVPAIHAGGNIETSSTARLPSSSLRCASITRRMYAASRDPRSAMTSARIASSSLPSSSMSSADRCAVGSTVFFWMTVTVLLGVRGSVVDAAGSCRGVDAGLDDDAVSLERRRDVAVAQVPHDAFAKREHAAVADAHPATAGHQHAGLLGLVEQRSVAGGLDARTTLGEHHGPAVTGHQSGEPELLGAQLETAVGVVLLQRLEQPGGSARQRDALVEVGHQRLDVAHVEHAVLVVVPRHEPDRTGLVEGGQVAAEDRLHLARRNVQHDDVVCGTAGRPDHTRVGDRVEI